MSAAGPVANMLFSCCQLVAAVALRTCIPWPVAGILSLGGAIWMFGELLYAITSACREDGGDFGKIRAHGTRYLMLAMIALIVPCALAIFACSRVFS